MPTKDKRFISVDTYARWRITDPLKFFQRLRDERGARSRLDGILDGETRNAVARHDLLEVVRSSNREEAGVPEESEEETSVLEKITKGRNDITRSILEAAAPKVKDFGIELIDLQFKRINYVEEVEKDVFARMIAERKRVAARYRSEGEGEAAGSEENRSGTSNAFNRKPTDPPRRFEERPTERPPRSTPRPTTETLPSTLSRKAWRPTKRDSTPKPPWS